MYFLDTVKSKITKEVNKALKGKTVISEADLSFPPNSGMGDISLACFSLAKAAGKNPAEMAQELAKKIKDKVCDVSAMGPYLNFTLNNAVLSGKILSDIQAKGNKYGVSKKGGKKKILVEYSNANTHKEYHIGHLRNISYGDSVYRLLKADGYDAIPFSYINDFGIHVAKTLWALEKFHKSETLPEDKGFFLGKVYVEATAKMEEVENGKQQVGEYMKAIESRNGKVYKLWEKTRKWSIQGFSSIYKELGVKFKDTWYENEFIDEGLKLVQECRAKGILKDSQGAVIADLEEYGLGVLVFLRADGTALYPVADLALAKAKFDKFQLDGSIYVVDIRQGQYFKQLFKVLELMGYKQQLIHLGYDFVTLPSGMMSSRTGNVVTYQDLNRELFANAVNSTREKHGDWAQEKVEEVAKKIMIGAMKFEMIKVSREKTITFDIEKSLKFEGFTAAYIQYTGARITSILRKAGELKVYDAAKLIEGKEHELVMRLAKYPETVAEAAKKYEPSEIAKYLFDLAQAFNDYYHAVQVLKADEEIREARLALLGCVRQTLANGLNLLGIEFIEEM